MAGMQPVRRVNTPDELREHIRENTPCIYTLPPDEPLFSPQQWSKPRLVEAWGDTKLTTRSTPSKKFVDPADHFWSVVHALLAQKTTLRSFLETELQTGAILSGTDTYLFHKGRSTPQWATLWEQVREIHAPEGAAPLFPVETLQTAGLWLSGEGVKTLLHYDDSGDHNLNIQVCGNKRITLFPPSDWVNLNTFLAMGMHPMGCYQALHQAETTNHSKYPLTHTSPLCAELQASDALFIPAYWFHFIEHRDVFNANISCWFTPDAAHPPPFKPRQSCRNVGLVVRLASAWLLAGGLTMIQRLTGSNLGVSLCRRMLSLPSGHP
jgi:hypothetical protein